ncbi:unnamed protein product [Orchesella dallaii]|uniref:CHK kinase-like domain-containing protein n=1 Tax=Orchesella dallaii TaxID=48710 RepID=A0ABP1RXC4_9HEXA
MADSTTLKNVIPRTESDISQEWIAAVTGLKPLPNTISITANVQDGIGFLSNLCRVSFKTEEGTENILVKLIPSNPEMLALTISEGFATRENQFYSIVLPQILSVVPEIEKNFCKFYCGNSNNSVGEDHLSMLIMEDLKPLGYENFNPDSEGWEIILENALKFVAKFHCAGLQLEKTKNLKVSEMFPFCMGINDEDGTPGFIQFAEMTFPRVHDCLEKGGVPEETRNAYKELNKYCDKIIGAISKQASKFPTLIHGDIWPPNMMITRDNNDPIKMIDWQILSYKDPCYELSVLMLTSLPKSKLQVENIDKFTKIYYQEFLKIAKDSDINVRSEEEFLEFFNTWGMCYGFLWMLLSVDAFEKDQERYCSVFQLLHEKYNVAADLLKVCRNL